jgi:hypothetical protein
LAAGVLLAQLINPLPAQSSGSCQTETKDRSTQVGKMIDQYLSSKMDLDDRVIHLLFSANRWEKEYVGFAPESEPFCRPAGWEWGWIESAQAVSRKSFHPVLSSEKRLELCSTRELPSSSIDTPFLAPHTLTQRHVRLHSDSGEKKIRVRGTI